MAYDAPEGLTVPDIASLKAMYADAITLTDFGRTQSAVDRDYFDGPGQWTPAERTALKQRKQPDSYFNRIRVGIEGTVGVIDQGQTDPRAWPRNPNDEDAAEVATKTLRYIEDRTSFDRTKIGCAETYFVEGIAAVVIELSERRDVEVNAVRFEEFFYDPRSRRKDFKDARYLGIAKWRYADEVIADIKSGVLGNGIETAASDLASLMDSAPMSTALGDSLTQDRPSDTSNAVAWVDGKKKRVMQVELYHQEGRAWRRCVFTAAGVLAYEVSAYKNVYGEPKCPIEAVACYIDRDNNRYGRVRDMRGPQDEMNKGRSKRQHILNTRQIQEISPGSGMGNVDDARREAAKPDGVLPPGWQIAPITAALVGFNELVAEARGELERLAPNPAVIGRGAESASGRAQLVRQQAGMTELAPCLGEFDDWVLRVYRAMWECARQFWTAPQFIRVTDEEGAAEFIGINQPPEGGQPIAGLDGQPLTVDGKPAFQTPGGIVLGYKNALAEMDVDITIETTPDTANVAQEQFMALVDLIKAGVQIPPNVLIKSSSLPDKRGLLDEMKKASEQPNPQAEIGQAAAQAELNKTQSETDLNEARKTLAEAQANALTAGALTDAHQAGMDTAHQPVEHAADILSAHDQLIQNAHNRQMAERAAEAAAGSSGEQAA